jgi:RNA polymerase sigma-70 factor (ECF subfamily)
MENWLAWLRRVLLNNVANLTRQQGGETREVGREVPPTGPLNLATRSEPLAPGSLPGGGVMAREQAEAVERAFRGLPEEDRQVIQLRQRDKLSFEEIGERMDRSAEAARKLWARAVERLQQEMAGPETRS